MSAFKKRKLEHVTPSPRHTDFQGKQKKARASLEEISTSKPGQLKAKAAATEPRSTNKVKSRSEEQTGKVARNGHKEIAIQQEESEASDGGPSSALDDGNDGKATRNGASDAIKAPAIDGAGSLAVDDQPEDGATPKTFAELGVIDSLCDACANLNFKTPTAIQTESIPIALSGRDIIGLAETGSGKTAAFALPILQALLDKPQPMFGLVLAPTRELAYQISQQFEALGSLINVRCAVIVGGMDMVPQAIALARKPHIIVATPGRLLDHLENTKGFSVSKLKYLVMDEADRLLDLDFGPILDKILQVLPRERKTMLFSATMSTKLDNLTRAALSNPVRVSISTSSYQTVANLKQRYLFIPHKFKDIYLIYLLHEFSGQSCILFTRTVHETQRLAFLLRALGRSAIPLHGQLAQSARLGALNKFRAGSRDILVATDVAARGLDIPSVDLVLNYDLPPDSKTYVHRVGRTARAGKSGVAVSVVTQYDIEVFQRIEKALGKKLEEFAGVSREEVMVFAERVGEAQRVAIGEMKNMKDKMEGGRGGKGGGIGGGRAKRGGGGSGGRTREGMDVDEG
ncbi:ribosomal RNA processing protein [Vermiconidia calcicola]|uniref:Ribosomal RNA processing protein n=1 Tax=Vermiconidia calcicola TaxID=1690605 RepID=A0ACC3MIB4_9PEZI|nr:ribosomal RNA processing protein [Vermiconidia calcicola]